MSKHSMSRKSFIERLVKIKCPIFDFGGHISVKMNVDWQLLQEYRVNRSSEAFATLMSRYRDFVYAAAMRQVDDPLIAEEITQAVFITLDRRASSLKDRKSVV